MLQELPIDGFEWVKETSQFNDDFLKKYNEYSDIGYFIEADTQCPRNLY